MNCVKCGAEISDGKKFCGYCGAAIPQQEPLPPLPAPPEATVPFLSAGTKRRLAISAVVVVAVVIIASALGYVYYHQPVRGTGSVSATTIGAGQGVHFAYVPSHGVSPFTYAWSFGDGTFSAEPNPQHTYNEPGTYMPQVTVSSSGGETTIWTTTVVVNTPPSLQCGASPSVAVNSLNTSFSVQVYGGTPDFIYLWQFGDGTTSNLQNPTHHYSLGKYVATVTVHDGTGMIASWSTDINVNLPLTVGVIIRWVSGEGESFTCTPSQGVPPYSFYWDIGYGISSTVQNFTYRYGFSGTTTVTLNVTDSVGESVELQRVIEHA